MAAVIMFSQIGNASSSQLPGGDGGSDTLGGGGGGGGTTTTTESGPTEDAAARFQEALDTLREESCALLHAALARCGLGDKKLRSLVAALRASGAKCGLTELDLSHNSISDAGAVALCAALTAEAPIAPRLTLLSLVGNPLGVQAAAACAHALATRPDLCVVLPAPAPGAASGAAEAGGLVATGSAGGADLSAYFASRGDDLPPPSPPPPPPGPDGHVDKGRPLLGAHGGLSFEQMTGALLEATPASASESVLVTDATRALLEQVEMECAQLNENPSASAKLLPRALKWCANNLGVLHGLLQPPPRPRVTYGEPDSHAKSGSWPTRLGTRRLVTDGAIDQPPRSTLSPPPPCPSPPPPATPVGLGLASDPSPAPYPHPPRLAVHCRAS